METVEFPVWAQMIYWVVVIISIVSYWKLYMMAGKPGWSSIIPIYNTIVYLQIAGRPIWWIILLLIPIVNIVIGIIVVFDFLKAFGKGIGYFFGVLFLPFIFLPMLAFGNTQYVGVGAKAEEPPQTPPAPPSPPQTPPEQPQAPTPPPTETPSTEQ